MGDLAKFTVGSRLALCSATL